MSRYQVKTIGRFVFIVDAHHNDEPLYRYNDDADGHAKAKAKCDDINRFFDLKAVHGQAKQHDEYVSTLRRHDWSYAFADDYSVYRRGCDERACICRLQREIDQDFSVWNAYAPEEYRKPMMKVAA